MRNGGTGINITISKVNNKIADTIHIISSLLYENMIWLKSHRIPLKNYMYVYSLYILDGAPNRRGKTYVSIDFPF